MPEVLEIEQIETVETKSVEPKWDSWTIEIPREIIKAQGLAEELDADILLMDERSGREVALRRNLPVVGTLGILERAAEKGLLDFAETLQKLKATGFFVAPALEKDFLERDAKRKNRYR